MADNGECLGISLKKLGKTGGSIKEFNREVHYLIRNGTNGLGVRQASSSNLSISMLQSMVYKSSFVTSIQPHHGKARSKGLRMLQG